MPLALGARRLAFVLALLAIFATEGRGQVHYHDHGAPFNARANGGPDAIVPGWFYNLGITGIRVQLVPERPTHLLVKYVFEGTPAFGRVQVGDFIVGAGGEAFETPHRNGYGMKVFGPTGPILDFANALEAAQAAEASGQLKVEIDREGQRKHVSLPLGKRYLTFAKTYPIDCKKSARIYRELCAYLVAQQRPDGSWGSPPIDLFAPLALLASGDPSHKNAVEKNARWHATTTSPTDSGWLINWRYMSAAIVLSEYSLATHAKWVQKELREIYRFLLSSQYTDLSQVNPKVKETHPDDYPKTPLRAHGGWGHNPGFEGYGPIAMLTGQGALAFSLMQRCGVAVDRARHDAAYAFLERGTGKNGYLWYADEVGDPNGWADMGRTGAAGIANALSPYAETSYRARALSAARVIGDHPDSFPDTHGSPILGMGFAAMAARQDPASFRRLFDANKWWFVLAQCSDGTFYYQPNRDNAGYGADSRLSASAVTAFMLSMKKPALHVTGKPFGN